MADHPLNDEIADENSPDRAEGLPAEPGGGEVEEYEEYESAGDPMVRWLLWGVIAVVVLLLSAGLFLVLWNAGAPRYAQTQAQNQALVLAAYVAKNPKNVGAQADYIRALINTGQMALAQHQIQVALKQTKSDPAVMLAEAQYYRSAGDSKTALKVLNDFVTAVVKARIKQEGSFTKSKTTIKPNAYSTELLEGEIMRAGILASQANTQGAIDALTSALAEDPTMADALVVRGGLYEKLGKKDLARADYKTALKYIPGYQPAEQALQKLGK